MRFLRHRFWFAISSVSLLLACGGGSETNTTLNGSGGASSAAGGFGGVAGATSASGGAGGSSNGGAGGDSSGGGGVAGAGGSETCQPGQMQACYSADPATLGVGPCMDGSQSCENGVWGICSGEVTPQAETCNGADDDCDGITDNAGTLNCGVGACQVSVPACENGNNASCTPLSPAPSEACDGIDDDCDGVIDEGCLCNTNDTQGCYTGPLNTLGLGNCALGTQTCTNGLWGACNNDVTPTAELCDGGDNDCDGIIDEGCACTSGSMQACYGGPLATVGVGECAGGTQVCTNGAWEPCNGDVTPAAEVCDGLDNDCDGQPDDGNPQGDQSCSTGLLGLCAAGATACSNGVVVCNQSVQASAELCDGLDNDCDGAADNGNPESGMVCNTGLLGVCSSGTTNCSGGAIQCLPTTSPSAESCDGADNNCNGIVDDGNPGGGIGCDTGQQGVCQQGTTQCQNGAVTCAPNASSQNETCDNLDNDCNGMVDDGNPGGGVTCNTGLLGVCAAGLTQCTSGALACNQTMQAASESCDGSDNDCDGSTDEGNPGGGMPCSTGLQGVCAAGTTLCSGGNLLCNQNVQAGGETCDGTDNDCDGMIDDGDPGGGQPCATGQLGICAAGTTSCQGGAVICVANNTAALETCDGVDNDCDGLTDEGDPGGGVACNTGMLGQCAMGTSACSGGNVVCNPNTPAVAELCDGNDNDCDGAIDNGDPGGGQACFTGGQGLCALGTSSCNGGAIVCNPDYMPTAELCDGFDNDCDGAIDDGNPGGGGACSTGLNGVCSAGTLTCQSAQLSCVQNVVASAEVCANGLDDNCDGVTDENPDYDNDGWGACDADCCNSISFCSSSPQLINPGAFEVVGNGLDDDCDPSTSDTVAAPPCSTAVDFGPVTAAEAAQAMELCQFTTANPPLPQRKWGVISAQHRLANGANPSAAVLNNMRNQQTAILANYGTNVTPQNGPTMAGISTGPMRDQNDPGYVSPQTGTNFGSTSTPPSAYLIPNGGALPASASCNGNCPAGSGANDSVNIRLTIRVPTNALSFSYKFKFYTSEYPEWTCTIYNDFYLALLQSGASGIPADTNISFDAFGNPFSVNNGFFEVCAPFGCYSCPAGTAELNGTGMGGGIGGGSQWLVTTSPVVPGETMVLELMTFDVSDGIYDTNVLLDDFQWALDPATVGTGTAG